MAVLGAQRTATRPHRSSRTSRLEVVAARKVRSKKQVAVSRTLVAKQGHEADVARLAGEMLKFTAEEAQGNSNKGILAFDCVRDGWEANTFHFWERYETTTAFGEHTTNPKMVDFMTKLMPHLEGPVGTAMYDWEDGRIGSVGMQAGPKGEGGLDDATGASGAAGGASYKQTSRAFDLTKVDEHEEAARDKQLLADMGGAKPGAAPVPRPAEGSAQPAGTGLPSKLPDGVAGLPIALAAAAAVAAAAVALFMQLGQ
ncbi:hypothetical protein HYH03_003242 [Edaphochlamys debaryana]|uniref:ABM domain-containing protein n=1 Tax=Edaphochlamys debaryana TaxID=47281 RepID=A0A835YCI7_9CHLO|nr:hypothetical protein HYH03_003242 [Edaphochlamys debaryana]|eukprot:KAG2499057.1 hypothetical protein HYH03_003242 [Edaphochlamys debaryana]